MAECLSRVRQARKKVVHSRGDKATVVPGGDGFACPASGCKSVFDTAEEALEHGATHGLSGEREVDDEGKSCCLWQGCAAKKKVVRPNGKVRLGDVRLHEALHAKGPKPREGFVCPECDEAYPTSAAAWACAATHDVEKEPCKCLWAGCGLVFKYPAHYQAHEPVRVHAPARGGVASRAVPPAPRRPPTCLRRLSRPPSHARPRGASQLHTGVWPYHCTTCNKGHQRAGAPRPAPHPMRSPPPRPSPPCLPLAAWATLCCKVTHACKCGWTNKGQQGPRNFKAHKARCSRGAAPELLG
eukprot:scaffold65897_cov43-Phaeocystis_antarctica.AAC.2